MIKITYKSSIPEVKQKVTQDALDAAAKGMYEVFRDSQLLVPLDKSPLRDSGTLTITKKAVIVSYGRGKSRKYAVDQHENMMYRHLPGRQAKYLEQPFRAHSQMIMADVIDAIKGALT